MSDRIVPKLPKWPFFLGDAALVVLAAVIAGRGSSPLTLWQSAACVVATGCGAWLGVLPFLREHQAMAKLQQTDVLASTVAQLNELGPWKDQVLCATAQWREVQEHSTQTVAAAREITDRMKKELTEFCAFLQQAQDKEKNHLRLEAEKLRRAERDWLQTTVHLLDHVFALQTAGARSGQPALTAQLNRFQLACCEVVRRLGLIEFAPTPGEAFDPEIHQPHDSNLNPEAGTPIAETLAPGFKFQSELVRRALVRVQLAESPSASERVAPAGEPLLL